MDLNDTDKPPFDVDLTDAEVYEEAGERVIAGGRWYVPRPDAVPADQPDLVIYQRPATRGGTFAYRSMVTAHDLRTDPTWHRVDGEQG